MTIEELDKKIDRLTQLILSIQTEVKEIKADVKALNTKMTVMGSSFAQLEKTIAGNVLKRLSVLEKSQ